MGIGAKQETTAIVQVWVYEDGQVVGFWTHWPGWWGKHRQVSQIRHSSENETRLIYSPNKNKQLPPQKQLILHRRVPTAAVNRSFTLFSY